MTLESVEFFNTVVFLLMLQIQMELLLDGNYRCDKVFFERIDETLLRYIVFCKEPVPVQRSAWTPVVIEIFKSLSRLLDSTMKLDVPIDLGNTFRSSLVIVSLNNANTSEAAKSFVEKALGRLKLFS